MAGIDQLGMNFSVALIDRLTKSVLGVRSTDGDLKPDQLRENFGVALHELYTLKAELQAKSRQLETECRKEECEFRLTIEQLRSKLSTLHDQFIKLDTQIHVVTGKLAHLGDQLERKSLPQKRIEDARDLILEFYKFLGAGGGTSASLVVNAQGDENQLLEVAVRIKNLSSLCLELPDDERFLMAKQRINVATQQLEGTLLERFRVNCARGCTEMMKLIADVLMDSKSHSDCTEIFVEEVLKRIDARRCDFNMITQHLVSAEKAIMSVFPRPENVLMQLIYSLVTNVIKPHMNQRIHPEAKSEVFLNNLYVEYRNMEKFIKDLSDELTLISDPSQLSKLFRDLFTGYLKEYMARERDWLSRHLAKHEAQFFESRGHQKRTLSTSGFSDFRRDLKAKLHIQHTDRRQIDYEGSLLSEEVAVNIIEDIRRAAKRCLLLSQPSEFGTNGWTLFEFLHRFLIVEHVDYGVKLALQGLQSADTRALSPNMVFFSVVRDASLIFQFFEKTLDDSIVPLISRSMKHSSDLSAQRESIQQDLQSKLQQGLERCLNLAIAHIAYILSNEQKKSDFRPDLAGDSETLPVVGGPPSQACQHVVSFLNQFIDEARKYLDGQNLKNFSLELGMRLNRTLADHFHNFTFSDTGGFLAMQDVTAYREVAKRLNAPSVDCLFDVLLKLMNLMLIKSENVQQVAQDYHQSGIPLDLLQNFIQLRSDYKTVKHAMNTSGKY